MSNKISRKKLKGSIIDWLSHLLSERFDLDIKLTNNQTDRISLTIADQSGSIIFPLLSDCFFNTETLEIPCTRWSCEEEGWDSVLESPLFVLGVTTISANLIVREGESHIIHYDLLGLFYWVLSRYEEVVATDSDFDSYGRFPASSSHAFKHGYLERPIVDEWMHILGQLIEKQWPIIKIKEHSFAIKLSHDVDSPSRYGFASIKALTKIVAIDILHNHRINSLWQAPWIRLNTRTSLNSIDPHNTFDWIMDESEQHGLTSAFYFICGRTDASKDADYDLSHPAIRDLIKRIYTRGHEIGLHPSYNSFQSPKIIVEEADKLRHLCREEELDCNKMGGRMHFLRWEQPTTLYGWEEANMQYDSTFSYADKPGFRCGTCHEYPAFDPVEGKMLKLRIRPLIAMECTIIADRFMGLGYTDEALDMFLGLKETCRKVKGNFTLLWHNSHFSNKLDKDIYISILNY